MGRDGAGLLRRRSTGGNRPVTLGEKTRKDAVTFLSVLLVVLFAIPAVLVFSPLGAFGTPANMLGAAGFVWWMCVRLASLDLPSRRFQPVHFAVLVLSSGALASYAHGMIRPIVYPEMRAADRGLMLLVAWAGITLVAADGIRDADRLQTLLRRLVFAASALAVLGTIQFATGFDISHYLHVPGLTAIGEAHFYEERSGLNRVAGTASHPIEFGVVLACVLPVAFHFAIFDADRSARRRWAPVVIMAVGILVSISRSAVIGVVAGGLVLVPTWPKRYRRRVLAMVPVFLVAMRLLVPGLVGTIVNLFLFFNQDTSTQARTEDYSVVDRIIGSNPYFGIGFRTYLPSVYGRVLDNQFLSTLVETGFVGLACLLVFLVVTTLSARGARRASSDPAVRNLAQSLTAAVVAVSLSLGTFDALAFPMIAAVLFLLVGCTGALWRITRTSSNPNPGLRVLDRAAA